MNSPSRRLSATSKCPSALDKLLSGNEIEKLRLEILSLKRELQQKKLLCEMVSHQMENNERHWVRQTEKLLNYVRSVKQALLDAEHEDEVEVENLLNQTEYSIERVAYEDIQSIQHVGDINSDQRVQNGLMQKIIALDDVFECRRKLFEDDVRLVYQQASEEESLTLLYKIEKSFNTWKRQFNECLRKTEELVNSSSTTNLTCISARECSSSILDTEIKKPAEMMSALIISESPLSQHNRQYPK